MRKENFSNHWNFWNAETPDVKKEVRLPHDAMIQEQKDEKNPSGGAGGYFPGGVYYYQKSFYVPEEAKTEHWTLEFEGVYREAYIYLNNCFIKANKSGYRGFFVELEDYLRYGEENVLQIKVCNDVLPNSRWYTGSGMYRPVWLWKGGEVRIQPEALCIETPEVECEVSKVSITTTLTHNYQKMKKIRLCTKIVECSGKIVQEESMPVTLFPNEEPKVTQTMYLTDVSLWSPDSPNLYQCQMSLVDDGDTKTVFDVAETYFGLRHIQIDPVYGVRINGEKTLLRGGCVHHDHGVLGAATFYDAEIRRVQLCKEAGFNALRIAHQPASKAMLDACDHLGMLLIEECFDVWNQGKMLHDGAESFADEWEKDVEAAVSKDYNHPSVFMYCIGNEIKELTKADGIRVSRRLANKFRELDKTRFVTNAINGQLLIEGDSLSMLKDLGIITPEIIKELTGDENATTEQVAIILMQAMATGNINDVMTALVGNLGRIIEHPSIAEQLEEVMSHLDVCGYNYMMRRYALDIKKYPNRVIFGSETNPPEIDRLWSYTLEYPACLGDFTWSAWDYIGEAGVGLTNYEGKKQFQADYPAYLAYCGDMDIIGHRRPLSYLREIVFGLRKGPYISVQNPEYYDKPAVCTPWAVPETVESWSWQGQEGKPVRVLVYGTGDEVALFCNEKEIGRKPIGKENRYQASFETTYESGCLMAITYENGKENGRYSLQTASEKLKLQTELSTSVLDEAGEHISFLSIHLIDENGILHTDKDRFVQIQTEEGVEVIGFGSANPYSKENFFDESRMLYRGKLLAVLRGKKCGTYQVTISSKECETVQLSLQVK